MIGVGIGVLGILLTTRFVELNNITPTLAIMIGLAVGIDYATLKNGLRLLRERELVQREGKTIRVKP